jgi:hypothetical protein
MENTSTREIHHGKTWWRVDGNLFDPAYRYRCSECRTFYINKGSATRHLATKHNGCGRVMLTVEDKR